MNNYYYYIYKVKVFITKYLKIKSELISKVKCLYLKKYQKYIKVLNNFL